MLLIAIHCFDVLDNDCSKKVASKMEKCCVHDIQAKICGFVVGRLISYFWSKSAKKELWKLELAQK